MLSKKKHEKAKAHVTEMHMVAMCKVTRNDKIINEYIRRNVQKIARKKKNQR